MKARICPIVNQILLLPLVHCNLSNCIFINTTAYHWCEPSSPPCRGTPKFIFKNVPIQVSFCLFSSFPHETIQIQTAKRVDCVLGTRTRGSKMEGAYESTEQWRHPLKEFSNPKLGQDFERAKMALANSK